MQIADLPSNDERQPIRSAVSDAEAKLEAFMEALAESVWDESDAEIENDIVAQGRDPLAEAERTRIQMLSAVASARRHSKDESDH